MQRQHDATTIRFPSIADLMVDSADRAGGVTTLANNFIIQRPYSMLNGSFTRVATTEIVMEWNTPNISSNSNPTLGFNGIPLFVTYTYPGGVLGPFNVLGGFYTCQQLIETLLAILNSQTATTNITWTLSARTNGPGAFFTQAGAGAGAVTLQGPLINVIFNVGSAGISSTGTNDPLATTAGAMDIRQYRYVDITSNSLTYSQEVKDSSTGPIVRDVLCRWYFDYDQQAPTDSFGFPILMGYEPFYIRRTFNPPKQIKWDTNLPVSGNIDFSMYAPEGRLVDINPATNFLMTLQISEN